MQAEIGTAAGIIWKALDAQGELSLPQLKNSLKMKAPLFDWAVGWLAREGEIIITKDKRTFRVCLKTRAASATDAP